jgi:hypothetical protein
MALRDIGMMRNGAVPAVVSVDFICIAVVATMLAIITSRK